MKLIENTERYYVDKCGKIYSKNKNGFIELKIFKNKQGYCRVNIKRLGKWKQVFVHRLVAEAFIGKVEGDMQVNHINGIKDDNNLSNLEIVTRSENAMHSHYILGNNVKPVYKLSYENFEILGSYKSCMEAGRMEGLDPAGIFKSAVNIRRQSGGFSWIFQEDYSDKNIAIKKMNKKKVAKQKKVYQLDLNTHEVIREYDGVNLAKRETGITTISQVLTGRKKSAGGYFWSYEGE